MKNTNKIIILGLGGQGVITAGKVIAEAGFNAGHQSSFLPTTGPEVHNGNVKAEIIVSSDKIYNPFISKADYVIVFHKFRLAEAKQYLTNDSILITIKKTDFERIKKTKATDYKSIFFNEEVKFYSLTDFNKKYLYLNVSEVNDFDNLGKTFLFWLFLILGSISTLISLLFLRK